MEKIYTKGIDESISYKLILDKFLVQVIKEYKKKIYPRIHRKLLIRDVVIVADKLTRPTIGRYKAIESEEYDYTHKITVSTSLLDSYLYTRSRKTYYKNMIKHTIAHEILHAIVKEKYERFFKTSLNDGSPIFLSLLTFFNVPSGHRAMGSFMRTELYKKVKEFNSFDELDDFIFEKLMEYKDMFRELEKIGDEKKEIIYLNDFIFSSGEVTGIKGYSTITGEDNGVRCKASIFEIGPYTEISDIRKLVIKKIKANSFENKIITIDKKSALKVQHMDV
ncbi:hypothetical protein [Clostridium sp. YIM B02506]|uniref:hypothetical protein n=1 Tax=Clostridium sp. YIM B02506 TaxID=2910680 RepID=UPI001EED576F|nr:hypothetical protein [Clostridium sp. YIM B02506]